MILCCGEALIDMLPVATSQGVAYAPHPGGGVYNTAIALGRLGAPAGFFSAIAADFLGQILRDGLAAAGVDASACVIADRPSTLAFVQWVDGQARYAFHDEGTAGRLLTEGDLPPIAAGTYVFGGISLLAEPCGGAYEALMHRAAGQGRVTMIDPNIRPGFVRNEASSRARLGRMLAASDLVKLSVEDLDWLAPGARDGFVAALLAGRAAAVLVTDGARGASVHLPGRRLERPARAVAVVDTVGAGDTFNAGVLASLAQAGLLTRTALRGASDAQWLAALDLGIAAAAVTVSRAGANPPWRHELG